MSTTQDIQARHDAYVERWGVESMTMRTHQAEQDRGILLKRLTAAEEQVSKLSRYTGHKDWCEWVTDGDCACGFDGLLRGSNP